MSRGKTVGLYLATLFVMGAAGMALIAHKTSAAPGGRAAGHGYFTNATAPPFGNSVILNGIPASARNKAGFISFIRARISSGSARDRTGAQFIVQLMRGAPYDYGRPTASDIADWEARLNQSSITLSVSNQSYTWDSAYDPGHNDDYFFQYGSPLSAPTLVFRNGGAIIFMIRLACANPIGQLPGLPPRAAASWSMAGYTYLYPNGLAGPSTGNSDAVPWGVSAGSTVWVQYRLRNTSSTNTSPTNIWWKAMHNFNGVIADDPPGGNSGTYAGNQQKVVGNATLTVPATAAPGQRFCKYFRFQPVSSTNSGVGHATRACVVVVAPPPPPPAPPTCPVGGSGLHISPGNPEPGQSVTVGLGVDMHTPLPRAPYTMTYSIGPSPAMSGTVGANASGNATSAITYAPAGPGTYTVHWQLHAADGTTSPNCSEVFVVAANPYFSVINGDTAVGAGMTEPGTTPTCTNSNDRASIVSWNMLAAGGYMGAGTRYAAFALNHIQSFATNQAGGLPRALAFANNSSSGANGADIFGGQFNQYESCVPNYYYPSAATATLGGSVNAASLATGKYRRTGTLTLSGGAVANGRHVTIYVSGNVYINGNITFSGSYVTDADIPSFVLVTTGNVYIDRNVTQLDGLYVAEPGSGGGTVYTCASGLGAPLDAASNTPANAYHTFYDDCRRQLVVNGAFVAARVALLRTYGSLRLNQPAEVFNYTPELWIDRSWMPADPSKSGGIKGTYDAIVSLPPVL